MTAFVPASDLPASVNTVEKNLLWSATVLNDLYLSLGAVESSAGTTRVIESNPYLITATQTPVWRAISRSSIELESTWRRGSKIWTYAKDFGTLAIPTEYKS